MWSWFAGGGAGLRTRGQTPEAEVNSHRAVGTLLFSPFACPSASFRKSFSAALAQRSAAKWVTLVGFLGASLKIPSSLPLTSLATFLRCSARLAGPPPPSQRGIRRSRRLAALDSARVAGIQGSFADSQGSRDGSGRRLWCRCVALFRLQEGGWMAREWRELQGVDWL
jgi:hypothetical protein